MGLLPSLSLIMTESISVLRCKSQSLGMCNWMSACLCLSIGRWLLLSLPLSCLKSLSLSSSFRLIAGCNSIVSGCTSISTWLYAMWSHWLRFWANKRFCLLKFWVFLRNLWNLLLRDIFIFFRCSWEVWYFVLCFLNSSISLLGFLFHYRIHLFRSKLDWVCINKCDNGI